LTQSFGSAKPQQILGHLVTPLWVQWSTGPQQWVTPRISLFFYFLFLFFLKKKKQSESIVIIFRHSLGFFIKYWGVKLRVFKLWGIISNWAKVRGFCEVKKIIIIKKKPWITIYSFKWDWVCTEFHFHVLWLWLWLIKYKINE
jgi:hypothetical protein